MRVSIVLVILALVFLGMKIPSCMNQAAVGPELMGKFEAQINQEIADLACVKEGPFPFSSRIGRKSEATSYVSYKCEKCDVLYQAGLLSKEVVEYTAEPGMQDTPVEPGMAGNGTAGFETRYDLTDMGASVYIPGTGDGPYSKDPSRFCFGKAKVHEITRTVGPVRFSGQTNVGIRYVAELENPHPFLADPRAQVLGIPLPSGNPALYPEANVTAVFDNNNEFYLDGSLQIN